MSRQTKEIRALEIRPASFTPHGAFPFHGGQAGGVRIGKAPEFVDVIFLSVADDHESSIRWAGELGQRFQQKVEPLFNVDAREIEQDLLAGFPTQLLAGIFVVGAGAPGEPERDRLDAWMAKQLSESPGLRRGSGQNRRCATKVTFFDQLKVRPFLPS